MYLEKRSNSDPFFKKRSELDTYLKRSNTNPYLEKRSDPDSYFKKRRIWIKSESKTLDQTLRSNMPIKNLS